MRKQQIAIIAFAFWLTIVSVLLLILRPFDFEIFFLLFLIGMLVIWQLMEPNFVQPRYVKYIHYMIAIGILIFGIIVVRKIIDIITS